MQTSAKQVNVGGLRIGLVGLEEVFEDTQGCWTGKGQA